MQKLKRNINMGFRVDKDEYDLITARMSEVGISSTRAYLLKMALNGMVVNVDLTDVRECSRLLSNISNNINQIAKRANETGHIYTADIKDIKMSLGKIWERQNMIIRNLSKVFGVAWLDCHDFCRNLSDCVSYPSLSAYGLH